MPSSGPKVSILIPTYNQDRFIETCITSALGQTYDNLEVIVCNDASNDATEAIARKFVDTPRFRYERNATNIGRVNNYRRLLNELACGEWMLMLDGDDCLVNPNYIKHAIELALSAPDVVLVFGKIEGADPTTSEAPSDIHGLEPLMDGTGFFLQHPPFYDVIPYHLTCLFERAAAIRIGFYRHDILSTDLESLYRLMIGHKIGYVDEVAGHWRQHEGNVSRSPPYHVCANNLAIFTSLYEHASSLCIASGSELDDWLRKGAARYVLFYLGRMLADGRFLDALRLGAHATKMDVGIVGHVAGRVARRMLRRVADRPWLPSRLRAGSETLLGGEAGGLDLIGCRGRILVEGLHGLARILGQILADEVELAQELVGHRDDIAAGLLGVKDVQKLARARPQQLRARPRAQDLLARQHVRNGIHAGIGNASGEHRDDRRRRRIERVGDSADLIERENRRDVEHHAFRGQRADELARRLPLGVGDRDLHVHVRPPGRNRARLLGHSGNIVGEHLERDRPVGDRVQHLAGESLVVADPGFSHQRRIGGEPLDHRDFSTSWRYRRSRRHRRKS